MNTLMTIDEVVRDFRETTERVAAEIGAPVLAVAIVAGSMMGAPVASEDLQWAANECSRAKVQQKD